jgi:uncharacterized iron-regulated membrane protein
MTIRKSLFWVHLAAGVAAALFIAVMCVTGTALAFEKQLVAWAERDARRVPVIDGTARLSLDELTRRVREAHPETPPTSVTLFADPSAAVAFALGRDRAVYVDPATGTVREPASARMHDFMHVMEDWHRWLALSGDHRPIGKGINGTANIAFFLLAITGLYLWIPKVWTSERFRTAIWFRRGLTGKRRDFNWHNVIGLWTAPVLIVLTLTAIPISFRWGSALVYRIVGDTPPVQAGPPGSTIPAIALPARSADARPLSREAQFNAVREAFPEWEQITLRLASPARGAARTGNPEPRTNTPQPLAFTIKTPGAWPRTATTSLMLDPFTGEVLRRESFADQSAGRRLRGWTRFLHTGEALGWPGQLAAGLACLGGCFLVYTGLALSWRRFLGPPKSKGASGRSSAPAVPAPH